MIAPERGKARSRLALVTGIILAFLSLAALVLSMGAPGLGWALASIILFLACLCSHWIGLRFVCLCLAVTVIHFVTFGPLWCLGDSAPLVVTGLGDVTSVFTETGTRPSRRTYTSVDTRFIMADFLAKLRLQQ